MERPVEAAGKHGRRDLPGPQRSARVKMLLVIIPFLVAAPAHACMDGQVRFGFYASFRPVSYISGTGAHLGYEADLLTAIEAVSGGKLSFSRRGITAWKDIWLRPAGPDLDMAGGGITILESRTRDRAGRRAIMFTAGHIEFRQSLLVRREDAGRLARYEDLGGQDKVGVMPGTTGEARFLELTAGARPRVVRLPDETALIEALAAGRIDAVAGADTGNRFASRESKGALVITALDGRVEKGGFALDARRTALAACLDRHIAHVTDSGRVGYAEWLDDPEVFTRRARKGP